MVAKHVEGDIGHRLVLELSADFETRQWRNDPGVHPKVVDLLRSPHPIKRSPSFWYVASRYPKPSQRHAAGLMCLTKCTHLRKGEGKDWDHPALQISQCVATQGETAQPNAMARIFLGCLQLLKNPITL